MLLGAWVLMVTGVLGGGWIEETGDNVQWVHMWLTRHPRNTTYDNVEHEIGHSAPILARLALETVQHLRCVYMLAERYA